VKVGRAALLKFEKPQVLQAIATLALKRLKKRVKVLLAHLTTYGELVRVGQCNHRPEVNIGVVCHKRQAL
jgi:hypothetical protein